MRNSADLWASGIEEITRRGSRWFRRRKSRRGVRLRIEPLEARVVLSGNPLVDAPEGEPGATFDLPAGQVWYYWDRGSMPPAQGTAPAIEWYDPAYDHNVDSWAFGPAELGYGDGGEATEISFGGDAGNKYVTTYFRQEFTIPTGDAAKFTQLTVGLQRDDGAAVYLNGTEVIRDAISGIIGEPIPYDRLATGTASGAAETTFFETPAIDPALLNDGLNTLAVEVHQVDRATSSDVSFDLWLNAVEVVGPNNSLSGTLTTDTVLTAADSPYTVTGTVTVPAGVTLSIEPGTTVQFQSGTGLSVNGRLLAEGTAFDRITFEGESGEWAGINFSGSMNDSRVTYADMDNGDSGAQSMRISSSQVLIDGMTWTGTADTVLEISNSNLIVRNSIFPSIVNNETVHGVTVPANGYVIFEGNTFGTTTGYSDVVDFTGGKLPNAVIQFINNVFLGGSDDGLDLDGTDALIEGNLFMHFRQDAPRESSSNAVATGKNGSDSASITVVRNIFFDNEHDVLLKEESSMIAENNVFVNTANTIASINFDEPNRSGVVPGAAAFLDGNIFWNIDGPMTLFENQFSVAPEPDPAIMIDNSIIPSAFHALGTGNIEADPMFVDAAGGDFRLLPGSPAIGAGPGGLDMGAFVSGAPVILGLPESPTPETDVELTVGGPGITQYRWRTPGGDYGPVTPVGTPIQLTGLNDGEHSIEVIGAKSAGDWYAGPTPAFGLAEAEIIAPSRVRSGELLPMVVRVYDSNGLVHSQLTTPMDLAAGALADSEIRIKKGVGSLTTTVNAVDDFNLELTGDWADTPVKPVAVLDAATQIESLSGTLAGGDTVWTAQVDDPGNPGAKLDVEYRITGDLTVPAGSTLTIEAGTRILLGDTVNFFVNGTIVSQGTADEPVLFSSISPAAPWGGLELNGTAGTFDFTFFINGAADSSKNFGHSNSQPVIMVDGSTLYFTNSFVINNVGKAFGSRNDSELYLDRMLISDVDTGGQTNNSIVRITNSHIMNVPDGDGIVDDDDNDGFYFSGVHSSGTPSLFQDSFVITTEDDGLDTNGAKLNVVRAWIEGAYHEGVAAGNSGEVTIDDSVFLRNDQGVESGWAYQGASNPLNVIVRNSVMAYNKSRTAENNVGLRFGDSYDWGNQNGHITARNDIIYDNGDNIWNYDRSIPGPRDGAIDVTYSMTNDPDYDADLGNITGIPLFSPAYYLLHNSPGIGQGEGGSDMGRVFPATAATFVVDNPAPRLRFSEVLADNRTAVDVNGTFPALIEIVNQGGETGDLSGMSITNGTDTFIFPAGTTLDPNTYLTLYADSEAGLPGEIHVGFPLDGAGDRVQWFDAAANGGALVDSVEFGVQLPDSSIARVAGSWQLSTPSFGSDNVAAAVGSPDALVINEWLAEGDGAFPDDFIEVFNPEPLPVDFGGLYLTNDPSAAADLFQITPLSFMTAGELIVFIADANAAAGPDHLNFELDAAGGTIALSAADLTTIDLATYGPQVAGVSEGRSPNGADFFTLFDPPTPGEDNPDVVDRLVPIDHAWKYNQAGIDLGTAWREPGYSDDAWPSGAALLYVEDSDLGPDAPKNTLLSRDEDGDGTNTDTYYFRTTFEYTGDPAGVTLQLTTIVDDGAVFYLNGQELHRFNMAPGPIVFSDWAAATVGNASFANPAIVPSTALQQGENVLAVEVHQINATSSDVVLGLILDALTIIDVTPPTAPADLDATVASPTRIDLAWTAATDGQSGIDFYRIYRDDVEIGTSTTTTLSDTAAVTGRAYTYEVSAVNNAGLEGARSAPLSATATATAVISFQDGVSPAPSYAGTRDTWLSGANPTTNYGVDVEIDADGESSGSREWALVKWDISTIPAGSRVLDATVTFEVDNPSVNTYDLYAVLRDWVEAEATWNEYAAGLAWGSPGATAASDYGVRVGSLAANPAGSYDVMLNADGVTLVQSWVDSPATNFGLFLYNPASTDGLEIDSREAAAATARPKLSVRYEVPAAEILDRHVLYGGSVFGADVATDKRALLPGQSATAANVTSFAAGINAVAIDVANLPDAAGVDENAFIFRVGNDGDSDAWSPAPTPSGVTVLPQAGFDRIVITWADGAMENQWLRVDVLAGGAGGVADTFYFGNAVGDGNGDAMVNASDVVGVRDHPRGPANPASIDDPWDYNRDGRVDADDLILARDNATSPLSALRLIDAPVAAPASAPTPAEGSPTAVPRAADALFDDRRFSSASRRTVEASVEYAADGSTRAAIDAVLTEPTRNGWMQPRTQRKRLLAANAADSLGVALLPDDLLALIAATQRVAGTTAGTLPRG